MPTPLFIPPAGISPASADETRLIVRAATAGLQIDIWLKDGAWQHPG
ncbi:hypothetical protein [Lihuaxuella thermophila]|nr:hypothetical protein [Lihuaxuella thermophila]